MRRVIVYLPDNTKRLNLDVQTLGRKDGITIGDWNKHSVDVSEYDVIKFDGKDWRERSSGGYEKEGKLWE